MSKHYVLRLNQKEELISSLLYFCEKNYIKSAWISGLGAIESATLATFNLNDKKYHRKDFLGVFELTSLTGNIAILKDQTVSHLHATISDVNFISYSGHLEKAIISVTGEIYIEEIDEEIRREYDPNTGLNLISN